MGYGANATGWCSIAFGRAALGAGANSIAMGYLANAPTDYSMALGLKANSGGTVSISIGQDSKASASHTTAVGFGAYATGSSSTAIGRSAVASGNYSTAVGQSSKASAEVSAAYGQGANASGAQSTAIGYNSKASNTYTLGLGRSSNSAGYGSISIGYNARALTNTYSLAVGYNSYCTGSNSSVFGVNANTTVNNALILGTNSQKVGIGTNNPYKASLHVHSNVTTYIGARFYNSGGANSYLTMNRALSIYAEEHIACEELQVFSDRRIKKNIVDIPDDLALQMVRDIPCRYYEYVDTATKGTEKTVGFIAQEVKEVLPMAVSASPGIVPDEYRELENFTWEETDDNKYKLYCDLQDCSGVTYRFIAKNDLSEDEGNIDSLDIVGNEDNSFTFEKKYDSIFCYGKKVDDFHRLDKQKIFAVAFSATQELDRLLQAEKAKVATLETQVADLLARVSSLESA